MPDFANPLVLTAEHMQGRRESTPDLDRIWCDESMRPDRQLQTRLDRILNDQPKVRVDMDGNAEDSAPAYVEVEKVPAGISVQYVTNIPEDQDSRFLVKPLGVMGHYISPPSRSFEDVLLAAERKLGIG